MIFLRPGRRQTAAFSSLYGAFGVVLVSLVVAGLIAKSVPQAHASAGGEREAAVFLSTLLGSTVGAGSSTVRETLSAACLEASCGPGSISRAAVEANISRLGDALAASMGRAYGLAVFAPSGEWLRTGSLDPGPGEVLGRADVFHRASSSFLTVTAWLGPS